MKKNEKILIIVLLVILVIAIVVFTILRNNDIIDNPEETQTEEATEEPVEEFVQVLEDGTKLNTSSKLSEMKELDGLQFGNIQLTEQNGQSVLLADVKNTTSEATDIILVDVTLLDKDGNELVTVGGIIGPLQPGETTQFNTSVTLDYANAYDFTITKK